MSKLREWLVLDLEGDEVLDSFNTKNEAVTWSVMHDGTFEHIDEYRERKGSS